MRKMLNWDQKSLHQNHLEFCFQMLLNKNEWLLFNSFRWSLIDLVWSTTWKVPVFGVFLVRIFPHSDWIRRDTVSLRIQSDCGKIRTRIPYSVRMWENMDQKKLRIRTLFTQKGYIVLKWVNQVLRVVLMPFASFAARQMFVQN